jgi:polyhydroxyalkanoate synthesis regulator phasin
MMNSQNVKIADENAALLFEQVMAQLVDRCIETGTMTKQQMVVILEDMIQQVERGTLNSSLNSI